MKLYSIMADGIALHAFTSHCTKNILGRRTTAATGNERRESSSAHTDNCICCLNGRLIPTSSSCTSVVRPPGITATSMSCMVSGFDVLSCVTFMRSSKLAGFVRLSKQHHYQCLVGVNYIYFGARYGVIIPRTWYSMQVVPLTRASKLSAN